MCDVVRVLLQVWSARWLSTGMQDVADLVIVYEDLDHGIEWVEDQILTRYTVMAYVLMAYIVMILSGSKTRS